MSNKTLEKIFQISAAVLLGVAAIFLWLGNYEGVFACAVLSSASYFLSNRYQVKERLDLREKERNEMDSDELHLKQDMLPEPKSLFDTEEFDVEKEKQKVLNER